MRCHGGAHVSAETTTHPRTECSGADALVDVLVDHGVEVVFGVLGGAALPVFDALERSGRPRVVATAHEQGAAFAADGYARVTGEPGVCVATSGPGALNLATGLGCAEMDSVPVVAVTGQVPRSLIGTDGFQESDVVGATMGVTAWNTQVGEPSEVPKALHTAFQRATRGRPAPTLVDIPKDVAAGQIAESASAAGLGSEQTRCLPRLSSEQLEALVDRVEASNRPMLLAGHGARLAGAEPELQRLAEHLDAPVATTLLGLGAFPEDHPLGVGMIGMHGTAQANTLLGECDLLVVLGARLDDRATGEPSTFAPNAELVHVDIDPGQLGKIIEPALALHADAKQALEALLDGGLGRRDRTSWRARITSLGKDSPSSSPDSSGEQRPSTRGLVEQLGTQTPEDAIVVSGVGQHQMFTALHFGFQPSHTWLTSGGLGAMGYALPAAIGAKIAAPEREVVVVDGDGCLHMTSNELATAVAHDLELRVFVVNNGSMGMVRQWQDLFFEGRQAASDNTHLPCFARLAQAYGARGIQVQAADDLEPAVEDAFAHEGGPVVVDVRVRPAEDVYPMVPPGSANHEFRTEEST